MSYSNQCDNYYFKEIDYNEIDKSISSILIESGLNKDSNIFFLEAAKKNKIDLITAFNIAYNWREITKTFLFSTIKGLGCLAEKMENDFNPNPKLLSVLQTGFNIISDDLNNLNSIFNADAPHGPQGTHYKWWENTILIRLSQLSGIYKCNLSPGTKVLVQKMKYISKSHLGVAVQLRVVEAIASDICIAFLSLFENLEHQGKIVFPNKRDLIWVTSHIQAEKIHHAQVCNTWSGMALAATTPEEGKELLEITKEYSNAWGHALSDFAKYLLKYT